MRYVVEIVLDKAIKIDELGLIVIDSKIFL